MRFAKGNILDIARGYSRSIPAQRPAGGMHPDNSLTACGGNAQKAHDKTLQRTLPSFHFIYNSRSCHTLVDIQKHHRSIES